MGYVNNVTDTLFADVSEFQTPVTDDYTGAGYQVLSIRSNDGTYQDGNFIANYNWCVNSVEAGLLEFFVVYYYWRVDTGISTHMQMVDNAGGPHPMMVSMIDLESGGNTVQDWSGTLNGEYAQLGDWLGNPLRAIGYANEGDLLGTPTTSGMWLNRPSGLRLIGAGYGANPNLPGQIAHQYTNGQGYGAASGLPDGAPPWAQCDMNSADGLSVQAFAAAVGLGAAVTPAPPVVTPPPVVVTPTPPVVSPITNTGTGTDYGDLVGVGDQVFTASPALLAQLGV